MDKTLFYIAISIFLGMVISYLIKPAMLIIIISLLLVLCLLFINRKNENKVIIFIMLAFLIGMAEYTWVASFQSKLTEFENENIEIEMLILDDGVNKGNYIVYNAQIKGLLYEGKLYNYKEKILFKNYADILYKAGDVVRARGQAIGFISKRNFGDQDYSLYNRSLGIYNQFVSRNNELVRETKNNLKIVLLHGMRKRLETVINTALPPEEGAFLKAVILGDKQWIDDEDLINFQKTGLSHLLSVSGLHVAFIAYMLNKILSLIKANKKVSGLVCGFILIYYVLLIGSPPPAVRALIMMLVLTLGKIFNKEYDLIASVSFAGILMLIYNPMFIHHQGFIISYSCIYSIAFLYNPIYQKLKLIKIPKLINKSVALSIAIQLGIAPILIHYFQFLSIMNIFLNIIAVPLTFAIIAIAFPGIILGIFLPTISIYVLAANYYLISLLMKIVEIFGNLPLAGINVSSLPIYIYLIYYLLLFGFINYRGNIGYYMWKLRFYIYMAAVVFMIIIGIKYIINDDLRIVVLDVGQGDSILITTPKGKNVLIDGGGSASEGEYYYDVGTKITVPALRKLGVWGIDTIMLSHIHEDHIEGLISVAEEFNIKNVVLPKTPFSNDKLEMLINISRNKGSNIFYVGENDKLMLEKDICMEILSPVDELIKGTSSDENNNSIVAKLKYKKFSMIFTGDIEKEAEYILKDKDIGSTVLKVPHHGSFTSSSREFIEKVSPKVSLITVGKNFYGHPSKQTLENIQEAGSTIYRTDINGAIEIITNGLKLELTSVR